MATAYDFPVTHDDIFSVYLHDPSDFKKRTLPWKICAKHDGVFMADMKDELYLFTTQNIA